MKVFSKNSATLMTLAVLEGSVTCRFLRSSAAFSSPSGVFCLMLGSSARNTELQFDSESMFKNRNHTFKVTSSVNLLWFL